MTVAADRVLDAAADLFVRDGYAATSIRDIANVVGLRPPSLYAHFRSKHEILAAILTRGYRRTLERMDAAARAARGNGAAAELAAMVDAYLRTAADPARTGRLAATEVGQLPRELSAPIVALRDELCARFIDVIERGRAAGELGAGEHAAIAATAIRGMGLHAGAWVDDSPRLDLDATLRAYGAFACRIVGAPG